MESGKGIDKNYPDYQVFKGLQRPLKFLIFDVRYIGWAVAVAAISLIGFIILFLVSNSIVAFSYLGIALGVGAAKIFLAQRKGLYAKKKYSGIYMYVHLTNVFTKDKW